MQGGMKFYSLENQAKEQLSKDEFEVYKKIAKFFVDTYDRCDKFVEIYKSKPKRGKFKLKIINRCLIGSGGCASWCERIEKRLIIANTDEISKPFILERRKTVGEFIVVDYKKLQQLSQDLEIKEYLDEFLGDNSESFYEMKIEEVCQLLRHRYNKYRCEYYEEEDSIYIYDNKKVDYYIKCKDFDFENKSCDLIFNEIMMFLPDKIRKLLYFEKEDMV